MCSTLTNCYLFMNAFDLLLAKLLLVLFFFPCIFCTGQAQKVNKDFGFLLYSNFVVFEITISIIFNQTKYFIISWFEMHDAYQLSNDLNR